MFPIEVKELRKEYPTAQVLSDGRRAAPAVDRLSFQVAAGEVFSLLGPNGAGKTTTVKMLCTLLSPTSGDATVAGHSIVADPMGVRRSIGVMLAGERTTYWKLTGKENLEYFAALYHIRSREAKGRIESLMKLVSLTDYAKVPVESYSTGMRIRLSFAKSLINDAPVLLLDEPTMSLDPQSARLVRSAVRDLRDQGKAILLTTHNLDEADQMSDRVGIMDHGKIVAEGPPAKLKRSYGDAAVIRVRIRGDAEGASGAIAALAGVEKVSVSREDETDESILNVLAKDDPELVSRLLKSLSERAAKVSSLSLVEPSLEDVFIRLTGKELRD
jgi:ABC-2 type transport system ATP-binding protein